MWNGHSGSRVQIGDTPRGAACVGVAMAGMALPARGVGSWPGFITVNAAVTVAPSKLVRASWLPVCSGVNSTA